MNEFSFKRDSAVTTQRRDFFAVFAGICGVAAMPSLAWAAPQQQPTMKPEKPSTGADRLRTHLHREADIHTTPDRVFEALLDSKRFAAFSGFPAEIDSNPGGAFTMFGGLISGRNVELVPNQRIVQAWRPSSWDAGVYSIVRFELRTQSGGTRIVLDHTGFPEGKFGGLDSGWKEHYFEPMKKFFA